MKANCFLKAGAAICLLGGAQLSTAVVPPGPPREGVLGGALPITAIQEENLECWYSVDWTNLPPRVSWQAGRDPFPLNLREQAERIRTALIAAKGITNQLDLHWIQIRRFFVPERQLEAHGRTPDGFTNQWFIQFSWRRQGTTLHDWGNCPKQHAIVLLDGTLATEKCAGKHPAVRPDRRPAKVGRSQDGANGSTDRRRLASEAPFEPGDRIVRSLEATNSQASWDPKVEAFPLELGGEVGTALAHLGKFTPAGDRFVLVGIAIDTLGEVFPTLADAAPTKHYWAITFSFASQTTPAETAYCVRMLLDKTLLGVVPMRVTPH